MHDFKTLIFTFRTVYGQADLLQSYTSRRSRRSSGQRSLEVPRTRLRTRGDCAFQVVAPKMWNELHPPSAPLTLRLLLKGS
ncbi:hypothetical protein LDENG_00215770 [Lucifuga dentata]|nr:hypothetical protein LDENG_00215770 [Lucifuga dentata]